MANVRRALSRSLKGLSVTLWRTALLLAAVLTFHSAHGHAQRSAPLAGEYIRTDFTVETGLADNVVNAIVQTDNGLLWVGTQAGVATFDGRNFHPIRFSSAGAHPQGAVHSLLVSSTGDLWIGTDAGVVMLPRKGLDDPDASPSSFFPLGIAKSDEVEALLETRLGVLWVGTAHGLYRLEGKVFAGVLAGPYISRLSERRNGNVVVVASDNLFEFAGDQLVERRTDITRRLGVEMNELFDVLEDRSGTTWYNTKKGLRRERGSIITPLGPPEIASVPSERTYEDPDGNLWVSTGIGVYKVAGDRLESTGAGVSARSMFVSRDGVLWVGTNGDGLLRFRRRIVRMFSKEDGLPRNVVMSVLPTHDGRLWVGSNCGLSVFDGANFTNFGKPEGLANTCVWSLAEDEQHALWVGTYGGGIFRYMGGHFTQYTTKEGLISNIVFDLKIAHDDSIWIATPDGLSHLRDGKFQSYTTTDGLSSNRILSIHEDDHHQIWIASQAGVDRLVGDRFAAFAPAERSTFRLANDFAEDALGHLYAIDTTAGLSMLEGEHLRRVDVDMNLMEMAESADHTLWFSSRHGLFGFARNALSDPIATGDPPIGFLSIGADDGLTSTQCSGGSPNIAMTADRKLYVATVKGLAMIDLASWPGRSHRPQVFLQQMSIDGKEGFTGDEMVLPPGSHRVEFHMAAVDLASPEKIRLQFRMIGVDGDWNDADASRTAIYTNIPPGIHTLLVRATDSNGIWDRKGRAYRIDQLPFFYQTRMFAALCLVLLVVALTGVYLVRVRHLIKRTRLLLEERVSERERIASDLHDLFFQAIQGLLLRFNTGTSQLSPDEPARKIFMETLEQSDQVMLEGRELVLDLHSDKTDLLDLPRAFGFVGDQFAGLGKPNYDVLVEGEPQPLHPTRLSELYRLGTEAIHNAFQHANAEAIEVELVYERDFFKLRIRDDGCGIDEATLREGRRPGHLGFPGMKKRAERMGAEFAIWSKKENGTEVEITIPARAAYLQREENPGHGLLYLWVREHVRKAVSKR